MWALGPTQPHAYWLLELFPGVKRPGREVNHPNLSRAEVKNEWSYASTTSVCLHRVDEENVAFHLLPVNDSS